MCCLVQLLHWQVPGFAHDFLALQHMLPSVTVVWCMVKISRTCIRCSTSRLSSFTTSIFWHTPLVFFLSHSHNSMNDLYSPHFHSSAAESPFSSVVWMSRPILPGHRDTTFCNPPLGSLNSMRSLIYIHVNGNQRPWCLCEPQPLLCCEPKSSAIVESEC